MYESTFAMWHSRLQNESFSEWCISRMCSPGLSEPVSGRVNDDYQDEAHSGAGRQDCPGNARMKKLVAAKSYLQASKPNIRNWDY